MGTKSTLMNTMILQLVTIDYFQIYIYIYTCERRQYMFYDIQI